VHVATNKTEHISHAMAPQYSICGVMSKDKIRNEVILQRFCRSSMFYLS